MNALHFLMAALTLSVAAQSQAVPVAGQIASSVSSNAIAAARVTLFTPDLQFFREARTDAGGAFQFTYVGNGSYQLAVAAIGFEYQQRAITVSNAPAAVNFLLRPRPTAAGGPSSATRSRNCSMVAAAAHCFQLAKSFSATTRKNPSCSIR
jgi:hypothetical protein